jgi:Domain of unknown function (DUF6916)
MLENLKLNSFSDYLGTKFLAYRGDDKGVELELIQAEDKRSNARQERFALLFRGPLDMVIEQGTYSMEHDKLGSFDLFIVPIGVNESGREYEAVFNRLFK